MTWQADHKKAIKTNFMIHIMWKHQLKNGYPFYLKHITDGCQGGKRKANYAQIQLYLRSDLGV